MAQQTSTSHARLGSPGAPRTPKGAIVKAIMALLSQEAQPMPANRIVHTLSAKFDRVSDKSIAQSLYRLAAQNKIDTIENQDGRRYYAHHEVSTAGTQPSIAGKDAIRAAILAALADAKHPVLLRSIVNRVMEQTGRADKRIYAAIQRLTQNGVAIQEERDGHRYIILAEAPAVEQVEQVAELPDLPDLPVEQVEHTDGREADQLRTFADLEHASWGQVTRFRDQLQRDQAAHARKAEREEILNRQLARERERIAQLPPSAIQDAIIDLFAERPRPHTRTYIVTNVSRLITDAPASAIHRAISILIEQAQLSSGMIGGITHIAPPDLFDRKPPAPQVEQVAELPDLPVEQVEQVEQVAEPPALPETPHFIDCDLSVAGIDLHARITLDLPNSIDREATWRYLVKWIDQLQRVTSDVLSLGAAIAERDQAMQLAQEEEQKRRELEHMIARARQALPALDLPAPADDRA